MFEVGNATEKTIAGGAVIRNRRGNGGRTIQCDYNFEDGTIGHIYYTPNSYVTIPSEFCSHYCSSIPKRLDHCKNYDDDGYYTACFNSWINRQSITLDATSYQKELSGTETQRWKFVKKIKFAHGSVNCMCFGTSLKLARERVFFMLQNHLADSIIKTQSDFVNHISSSWQNVKPSYEKFCLNRISCQMDSLRTKESMQGEVTQESEKANNTIVTRDESKTVSMPAEVVPLNRFASSEPIAEFDQAVNRWVPLIPISVSTQMGINKVIKAYYFPESLYEEIADTINLMPFENYIYSELTMAIKFVVNANRFQCGKIICSVKFDSSYSEDTFISAQAALCRPHVILDLAANNEGELNIPFRYHRAFVRNVRGTTGNGVRPSKYATVLVQVLSQLRTGVDNPTFVTFRPYITFKKAEFAATSYRVATQMDSLIDIVDTVLPNPALHAVLSGVEKLLTNPGKGRNRDKPTDLNSQIIVPHPARSFCHGKGPMNVVPLRMDPTTMTSVEFVKPYEDDPLTTLQIAQIWGLRSSFTWNATHQENDEIFSISLDPSKRDTDLSDSAFTPLEQMCSLYQFWTGTYELRFDFVSNAFHTGAILLSIEFSRPAGVGFNEMAKVSSNYTKTFHLGEQKSVTLRVPYIYDTLWRRCNTPPFAPRRLNRTSAQGNFNLGVEQIMATRLSCRVVNKLLPTQTVSQSIDVLVFMRGSPNFRLHSLKQAGLYSLRSLGTRDQFPRDYTLTTERKQDHNKYNERSRTSIPAKIITQMDAGDKEDLDPTDQFSVGVDAGTTQTNDSQVIIKDIIRRPTMIIYNARVRVQDTSIENVGSNSGYFIPIMPPTPAFLASNMSGILDTIVNTPQSRLLNMFKFCRGSCRYTIIVHDSLSEPLFVTHVPHSGIQLFGNALMCEQVTPSYSDPIFACGLHTEVIIASINPMMTFEVPFDTENNWICCKVDEVNTNYPWRDKADTNAGHLVLSSVSERTVSVWWSAGDDFELGNFYGIENVKSEFAKMPSDNYPTITEPETQADVDPITTTSNKLDFHVDEISDCRPTFSEHNTQAFDVKIPKDLAEEVKVTTRETRAFIHEVRNGLMPKAEHVFDTLKSILEPMMPTDRTGFQLKVMYEVLWGVANALITRNWASVGLSIFRSICELLDVNDCIGLVMKYSTKLGQALQSSSQPSTQAEMHSANSTIVGILVGFMGQIFKVTLDRKKYENIFDNVSDKLTSAGTWGYLNQCLTYIQRIYSTVAELAAEAIGKMDPEVTALKLLCDNNAAIAKFADDVSQMTSPVNYQMMKDPTFRLKYWRTHMQALQIQRLLATAPASYAKPGLLKMCLDMKRHADENTANLMSHPCRPEPLCIQITGEAGIGKSHLSHNLLSTLASNVNPDLYKGGLAYLRNPASKFWNGFRGEFGIIIDDFVNLNNSEHITTQLSELFALKTRQDFIPEMAAVEKKEIFAAPLVVLLLSNEDFPTCIENAAFTPEAVFRRRDILIRAELKKEYKGVDLKTLPSNVSEINGHLEFKLHNNPRCKSAGYDKRVYSWLEMAEYLSAKFTQHLDFEKIEVRKRLHAMRSHAGGISVGEIDLKDPFSIFYSLDVEEQSKSPTWVPSQALEESVRQLSKVVDTIVRQPETQSDEINSLSEIVECSHCKIVSEIDQECCKGHKLCQNCVTVTNDILICVVCRSTTVGPKTQFSKWIKCFIGRWQDFIQLVLKGGLDFVKKILAKIKAYIANCKIRTESDTAYNPLHLQYNPNLIKEFTKVKPNDLPQCYHQHVIDNIEDVTYYQSKDPKWRILLETEGIASYLNVPLYACCATCPFTDFKLYAETVRKYISFNKNMLFSNLLTFYNANESEKADLLQRIPVFLRPDTSIPSQNWYEYLSGAFLKYKKFLIISMKIGICCTSIIGLLSLFLGSRDKLTSEGNAYEAGQLARLKRTIQIKRSKRERVIRTQSDMSDVVESKIMQNYVIMRMWKNGVEKGSLVLVGIYAHQAVLPKHSLRAISRMVDQGCEFTIEPALYSIDKKNFMRSKYTYSVADFRVIDDTDIACMQMPASYPLFKDIRKFFCTESEAAQHLPREAYLILAPTRARQLIHVKDVDITGVQKAIRSTDPEGESFIIDLAIVYDHSEKGACGSLLLLENRNRPIYAMHVAGENSIGYGLQLTQEAITNIVRQEIVTQLEEPSLLPISEDTKCFLLGESARVKYLGLVPKELKPHIPNATDIQASLVQNKAGFVPTKEPAILSPTDPRYKLTGLDQPPLWYGCMKHGIQTTDFPSHILKTVYDVLWTTKFQDLKPVIVNPTRLTPQEAVTGLRGIPYYEPIKLATSSGYPWQRLGKNTLKDSWIEPIRNDQLEMIDCKLHPDLLSEIRRKEELRKQGIQPVTIFTDTLKDETRKKSKVLSPGGTRVFCASPVDYTIAQRQNLLHLCAAIMKTRLNIHCAVGINAKGTEWTELVNYLAEVGLNHVSTFDYSDFGPALNAQVAYYVAKLMAKWTCENVKDTSEKEVTTILYECINSVHCAAGTVYQQYAGSPSGASITTIINSIVNMFYIYTAWEMLMNIDNKWDVFRRNVRFVVYGDDLIMSISEHYKDSFNACILSKFFGEFNIVATDASKQKDVVPHTTIFEASFLKRGFRMHPNGKHWLGPLEWDSINDTTQWVRKSSSKESSTLQNCEAALMEAHAHGPKIFNEFRIKINAALSEARIKQKLLYTWEEIDKLWFQEGEWPILYVSDLDPLKFEVDFLPYYKRNKAVLVA